MKVGTAPRNKSTMNPSFKCLHTMQQPYRHQPEYTVFGASAAADADGCHHMVVHARDRVVLQIVGRNAVFVSYRRRLTLFTTRKLTWCGDTDPIGDTIIMQGVYRGKVG